MKTPEPDARVIRPIERLALEEPSTLRGIVSAEYTVDRPVLERLIATGQEALDRQVRLLRDALDAHQAQRNEQGTPTSTLKRLETMLEHTARLVHESQVLQKLRMLLTNG